MPKERDSFKYKLWRVVVSSPFEYFIMLLIVLNTLLLMMKVKYVESSLFRYWTGEKVNVNVNVATSSITTRLTPTSSSSTT